MPRHAGLLVFVVALAVRLAYLALVADDPAMLRTGDTPAYERAAAALAATGRERVRGADGRERLFVERPPGYVGWLAAFRAAFGADPLYPLLAQAALDAFACLLVAALAALASPRLALLAGLLAAANLNMTVQAAKLAPASLVLLCALVALAFLARYARLPSSLYAMGAGLGLGAAWLLDPAMALFVPVALAVIAARAWRGGLGRRAGAGHLALALAGAIAFVAPFYARTVEHFGTLRLAAASGGALYQRVAPAALELGGGVPRLEAQAMLADALALRIGGKRPAALAADPFIADAALAGAAKDVLARAGAGTVAQGWLAGATLNLLAPSVLATAPLARMDRPHFLRTPGMNPAHKAWNYLAVRPAFTALVVAGALFTALCRAFSAAGLLQAGRRLAPAPVLLLLALGLFGLLVAGPVPDLSGRLLLEPGLAVLLAAGVLRLRDRRQARLAARVRLAPAGAAASPVKRRGA